MRLVCFIVFFSGLCHGVSKATGCTGPGKFVNNDAGDCRGYMMCLYGGVNGFTPYKLNCPVSFIYSHLEHQCTNTTTYRCLPDYKCNTTGNFEDLLSTDCKTFIACPEGMNGMSTARLIECPAGEVFNPIEAACVKDDTFICSAGVTSATETVTEVSSITPVPHNTSDNVGVTGDNGFEFSGNVNVNSAADTCNTSKHAIVIAFVMFLNIY